MSRLIVRNGAWSDVDDLAAYIAPTNLPAALRFYDAAQAAFDLFARMPRAGPRFEPQIASFPELRFWPITGFRNYLVLYQPVEDGTEIIRVIHGARDIATVLRQRE